MWLPAGSQSNGYIQCFSSEGTESPICTAFVTGAHRNMDSQEKRGQYFVLQQHRGSRDAQRFR